MKIAVLIIAHKNLEQLIRLSKVLYDRDIYLYVHIDKKWNLSETEIKTLKASTKNISVIDKRISGFLDTWSLCQITIELMKEAIKSGKEYSYYVLLSGQDYPIKPISYIKKTLEQSYPKPFIDCTPMVKDNWIYSGFKWIRFHAYYRLVERITSNKKFRKLLLLPAYAVQFVVTFVVGSPYKRLEKEDCELYGGSAWWILPDIIVKQCVDEVTKNTNIVKAFKLKNTPEETFFQTMSMRSELRDLIDLNSPYEILQNCMTYAHFFDGINEPTGHPFILTEENFNMLKSRKEFFARKFELPKSKELMNSLDEYMEE